MAQQRRSRRRKIYVNPMIQGRMLARMAVYWGIYHVVLWHAMFLYHFLEYREALLHGAQAVTVFELYRSFAAQNYPVVVCALAVFPVVLWDMLSQTHRIAGPLVRFQNALRQLAAGHYVGKVKLRKDDLLMDFQEAFNDYLDSLDQRPPASRPAVSGVPDDHGHLLDELHEIRQAVDQGDGRPAPASASAASSRSV